MKETFVTLDEVREIAKTYPTPFYLYDEKGIRENMRHFTRAFSNFPAFREYFAVKAHARCAVAAPALTARDTGVFYTRMLNPL